MGKYTNSIYALNLNRQKIGFIIEPERTHCAESTYPKPSFSLTLTWQKLQSPNNSPYITRT